MVAGLGVCARTPAGQARGKRSCVLSGPCALNLEASPGIEPGCKDLQSSA